MKRSISLPLCSIIASLALAFGLAMIPTSSSAQAMPDFCKQDGVTVWGFEGRRHCSEYINSGSLMWDALNDWRISPDYDNPNPDQYANPDTWTYMWSPTPDRIPDNYLAFTHYTINGEAFQEFWDNEQHGRPSVGLNNTPEPEFLMLDPTVQHLAIVRWKSPITGHVSFRGWFYPHEDAGDGIKWYIDHEHEGITATLAQGTLNSGGPAYPKLTRFYFGSQEVSQGDSIYFIVDAGLTDAFDGTLFNVTFIGPEAID